MKQPPRIYRPDVQPVAALSKPYVREVKFTIAKNGQRRATYWSKGAARWLPIPVVEAEYFVSIGQATEAA
jgi:hypothetical protein